jgi:hypothetical protein
MPYGPASKAINATCGKIREGRQEIKIVETRRQTQG